MKEKEKEKDTSFLVRLCLSRFFVFHGIVREILTNHSTNYTMRSRRKQQAVRNRFKIDDVEGGN